MANAEVKLTIDFKYNIITDCLLKVKLLKH